MSLQTEFDALMASHTQMQKHAFDLGSALDLGLTTYGITKGLVGVGLSKAPDFLHTGLQNGMVGRKLNHYHDTLGRTFLSGASMRPHDEGMLLGKTIREHDLNGSAADDFLHEWVHNKRNEDKLLRERLMDEGKGHQFNLNRTPALLEHVMQGSGDTKFSRFLLNHSVPEEMDKHLGHKVVQVAALAPALAFDKRTFARSVLDNYGHVPAVQKVEEAMQKNKVMRGVRNYIG